MQELLRHYESELVFLRGHAGEFARQNPKIAGHLLLGKDGGEDPHVQRLIEAFALLTSRVHKRLDDDFPLFTEALLEVLYPHYLRPFPACSIARFGLGGNAAQMTRGSRLPRGTLAGTRPIRGVTCMFRTSQEVALLPVQIVAAEFRALVNAPDGTAVPRGATGAYSITLELTSPQATWASLEVDALRIFLDGEASQVSALREAFCGRTLGVLAQTAARGPWAPAEDRSPVQAGFDEQEALIEFDARSHPAYRLLTEYFAFPEKFNFLDVPLPHAVRACTSRNITLHLVLSGLRSDSDEARVLETTSEKNLLLGCSPVVNLFAQKADPIRVTHTGASYPVLPDSRRAFGYEVYSVDSVYRVQQTPQGETIEPFRPFYSLQHEALLAEGEGGGRYWSLHRDDGIAEQSPGYETELSVIDIDADPAAPETSTLSITVTATNRDLPSMLSVGNPGGDLFIEGGGVAREIHMLRKPSRTTRFARGHGALWRLISHLSLNHLSLSGGGGEAIRELLRLYDLPRSATNARQIAGVVGVEYAAASACMPGNPFMTFVRGTEIRVSVEEQHFVGSGLRLFAQLLDHFFGLYVHVNSFTQLKLLSSRTREELIVGPRRGGDGPLL